MEVVNCIRGVSGCRMANLEESRGQDQRGADKRIFFRGAKTVLRLWSSSASRNSNSLFAINSSFLTTSYLPCSVRSDRPVQSIVPQGSLLVKPCSLISPDGSSRPSSTTSRFLFQDADEPNCSIPSPPHESGRVSPVFLMCNVEPYLPSIWIQGLPPGKECLRPCHPRRA